MRMVFNFKSGSSHLSPDIKFRPNNNGFFGELFAACTISLFLIIKLLNNDKHVFVDYMFVSLEMLEH
jgi:hypothetical protein